MSNLQYKSKHHAIQENSSVLLDFEQCATNEEKRRFLDSIAHCTSCTCRDKKDVEGKCFLIPKMRMENMLYDFLNIAI